MYNLIYPPTPNILGYLRRALYLSKKKKKILRDPVQKYFSNVHYTQNSTLCTECAQCQLKLLINLIHPMNFDHQNRLYLLSAKIQG